MPTIKPLATLTPPCNARTWSSAPHPHLPILATACSDKTARIYSLATFTQQSIISGGHKRSIRSCAWKLAAAKNQSVLATGSFDSSVGVWKRWEGDIINRHRDESDFTGRGLAGGNDEGGAGDEDEEEEEWRFAVILDGHDSEIKCLAFAPRAPLLATCSRDKSVWIWEELEDDGAGEEDNFETVAVLQEHEGDVKCVGWHPTEELLASGSYDDDVRLWKEDVDDWACCAVLSGHKGTVWWVEFENPNGIYALGDQESLSQEQQVYVQQRLAAGPRLITCSDDLTIRIWRRIPKDKPLEAPPEGQIKAPSIWKNRDFEEEWVEEARLPTPHELPIYSVSWSKKTGKVVSTGSDGKIVVYEERWRQGPTSGSPNGDTHMAGGTPAPDMEDIISQQPTGNPGPSVGITEWTVAAEIQNAHDVFEVNHVIWAPRADKGKRYDDEEIIVSTGDDGEVRVWTLED